MALAGNATAKALFAHFAGDMNMADPTVRSVHLIFAAAFSAEAAVEFAKSAYKILRSEKDSRTIASVAYALSLLEMDRDLASRLLFVSFGLLLFEPNGAVLPLLSSALRQFGPDRSLCEAVSADAVAALSRFSGLDFASDAVFSALMLVALNAEPNEAPTISEIMASGTDEPLARVFSLVVRGDALPAVCKWDFESKFANVAVAVLLLLNIMPNPDLVRYAMTLCSQRPTVFAGIPMGRGAFAATLRESGALGGMLIRASRAPAGQYKVSPVFEHILNARRERVKLSGDQLDELLSAAFE
jgi:hypothetical protein